MRLSTRARYAVRIMLELGLRASSAPVPMPVIARKAAISKPYVDQLATALRHADLIRSRSGRHGGYVLARSPDRILLREIVEAAAGALHITECVQYPDACARSEFCVCRKVWSEINDRIRGIFDDYSLADLLRHEQARTQPQGCLTPLGQASHGAASASGHPTSD